MSENEKSWMNVIFIVNVVLSLLLGVSVGMVIYYSGLENINVRNVLSMVFFIIIPVYILQGLYVTWRIHK